ncbi:DoxX family protein [Dietzia lutea]|uniref:DoxX family protein n=1 Tax=Dietzia lutea TaxID=546160 RepID=UPI000D54FCB1|nr:DoxX family protein [Dietzia lutea]
MTTTVTRPEAADSRLLPVPAVVRDAGLLLTRALLGVVLIAHGWEKFAINGIDGTGAFFDSVGVPGGAAAAAVVGAIELVGGILLILGLLTPVVAVLVVVVMIGAFFTVHIGSGVYVAENGWELVAVVGLAAAVFGLVGPGRYSVDAVLAGRRAATA